MIYPTFMTQAHHESLIQIVLNLQETIRDLTASVQELKDELRRLRGEKGRPEIKPSVPDEPAEGKSIGPAS